LGFSKGTPNPKPQTLCLLLKGINHPMTDATEDYSNQRIEATKENCPQSLGLIILWDLVGFLVLSGVFVYLTIMFWYFAIILVFMLLLILWGLWMLIIACGRSRNESTYTRLSQFGVFRKFYSFFALLAGVLPAAGCIYVRLFYQFDDVYLLLSLLPLLFGVWFCATNNCFVNKVNNQHRKGLAKDEI
jgi:hypothetical protein